MSEGESRARAASQVAQLLRKPLIAAPIAFVLALAFLAPGITAPFVKDAEPQAAQWIQTVAQGRELLVPRDYYGELARKPPLLYWLGGAVTAATGGRADEARARVTSLIAAAVIASTVLLWTGAMVGAAAGWLSFLFLLGSYAFASRATLALQDMLLAMLIFLAWCLAYRAIEERPSPAATVAMGVALGLAVMSKGPIGLVLPGFGALIYLRLTRRPILGLVREPWPWIVLAISMTIAIPWYAAALGRSGGELARIMWTENTGHFVAAGGTGEAARPFYYIAMKMLGWVTPLNVLVPALVFAWWRRGFTPHARRPLLFQASFVFAVLIFFSAANAKRDDYVLPAIGSLAILFAALFTALELPPDAGARIAAKLRDIGVIVAASAAVAVLILVCVWSWSRTAAQQLPLPIASVDLAAMDLLLGHFRELDLPAIFAVAVSAFGVALIFIGVARKRAHLSGAGLGALSLLGVLLFTAVIRPELDRRRTLKLVAADIGRIADGAGVYGLREEYELSFYLGRAVPRLVKQNQLVATALPAYVFAYPVELERVGASVKTRTVMVKQWYRIGKSGSPALYRLEPAPDLKPPAGQDR